MAEKYSGYTKKTCSIFATCLIIIFLFSCRDETPSHALRASSPVFSHPYVKTHLFIPEFTEEYIAQVQSSYDSLIREIKSARHNFAVQYHDAQCDYVINPVLAKAKSYLVKKLDEEVLPAWYGTKWAFEGYTDKPLEGCVACGYFITTPLKHIGFNLNRFRMAQKYSHDLIRSLCDSDAIAVFPAGELEKRMEGMAGKPDDIYVVGLDCHVGFLVIRDGKPKFVHSDYCYQAMVKEEDPFRSAAFMASEGYVIGSLFSGDGFIANWLTNDTIK